MTTSAPVQSDHRGSARERLLQAANDLFYSEGIQTVGIDRIIERAGVAKASLYNLFGSKEELVAAYLSSRHHRLIARLTAAVESVDDPREQILAVFDAQARLYAEPDYRGCPFVAASTEAPSGGRVEQATDEYRAWIRALFTDLAGKAGAPDPVALGRQLQLVYDGAGLAARLDHDPTVAPTARAAVEALLDCASSASRCT
ncbi:MAG: TetR/AcrR family transcriptional regulator [Acidimicrobiales bacterium]